MFTFPNSHLIEVFHTPQERQEVSFQGVTVQRVLMSQVLGGEAGTQHVRAAGLCCCELQLWCPFICTPTVPSAWRDGRGSRYHVIRLECFIKVSQAGGHCPVFSRLEWRLGRAPMSLETHRDNCSFFLSRAQGPSVPGTPWLLSSLPQSVLTSRGGLQVSLIILLA